MRITDNSVYARMNRSMLSTRAEAVEAQDRASSGIRVAKPSDDPGAFAQARRERAREALGRAGTESADAAWSQLSGADDALNSAGDALARARELALRGSNDTLGAEERATLALEAREIRKQMTTFANTQVQGAYVFAGNATDKPAFESDGTFLGTHGSREVQALPGVRVQASLPGGDAFGAGESDDIFSSLDTLLAGLESNDPAQARASLGGIDISTNRILGARATLGGIMNSLQTARSVAEKHADISEGERGRLTEIDEVSAATAMLKATSAYNSAVAIAQKLPLSGLVGSAR